MKVLLMMLAVIAVGMFIVGCTQTPPAYNGSTGGNNGGSGGTGSSSGNSGNTGGNTGGSNGGTGAGDNTTGGIGTNTTGNYSGNNTGTSNNTGGSYGNGTNNNGSNDNGTNNGNNNSSSGNSGSSFGGLQIEVYDGGFTSLTNPRILNGDMLSVTITNDQTANTCTFTIPDFNIRMNVAQGQTTSVNFTADKTGTHYYYCDNLQGGSYNESENGSNENNNNNHGEQMSGYFIVYG